MTGERYLLVQTRNGTNDVLYEADSLEDVERYISQKTGTGMGVALNIDDDALRLPFGGEG